jgi:hypothetical protein
VYPRGALPAIGKRKEVLRGTRQGGSPLGAEVPTLVRPPDMSSRGPATIVPHQEPPQIPIANRRTVHLKHTLFSAYPMGIHDGYRKRNTRRKQADQERDAALLAPRLSGPHTRPTSRTPPMWELRPSTGADRARKPMEDPLPPQQ